MTHFVDVVEVTFDPPDDQALVAAFDAAYLQAPLTGLPKGGSDAAAIVELALRSQYPNLRIFVESGSSWVVARNPRVIHE